MMFHYDPPGPYDPEDQAKTDGFWLSFGALVVFLIFVILAKTGF